jgi:hypothetical protein
LFLDFLLLSCCESRVTCFSAFNAISIQSSHDSCSWWTSFLV